MQLVEGPQGERGVVRLRVGQRCQHREEVVARTERTEQCLGQGAPWGRQVHAIGVPAPARRTLTCWGEVVRHTHDAPSQSPRAPSTSAETSRSSASATAPCSSPARACGGRPRTTTPRWRCCAAAVELGVTFFDTADSYGPETAEQLLKDALHPYADDVVIATKAGLTRQGPGIWTPLGRPPYLRQQCELSLRRLGVETDRPLPAAPHRRGRTRSRTRSASSRRCRTRARSATSACPR